MRYERIIRAFFGSVWAIERGKFEAIKDFLALKAEGVDFTAEEIAARIGAAARSSPTSPSGGAIAILPIYGLISQKVEMAKDISGPGGTSTDRVSRAFKAALADSNISAIVLDVDSPGGTVYGVSEVADEIFRARGQKPIIASVNSLAASAAYWIATAADEVVVTPGGEVGSVGVFAEHLDISKFLDSEGVKPTLISAGKYKVEGNQYEPLTDEARAAIQDRVDEYYDMFVKAVARNRGVTVTQVEKDFGEGRVVGARQAVASGMADRIGTLDQVLKKLTTSGTTKAQIPGGTLSSNAGPTVSGSDGAGAPSATEPPGGKFCGPIPSHSTATSDGPWDGPANEARLPSEEGPLRRAHAWVDSDKDPNTKAAYKFIHHEISEDGKVGAANMTACSTGIGVLNGGRGGTTIPESDKKGVHDHLARHMKDGGKEPPPLKSQAELETETQLEVERLRNEFTF